MGSLLETLQDPERRGLVLDDCEQILDAEVRDKSGMTGVAVKAAFRVVRSFKPGIIRIAMEDMIDEFAEQIDPFWAQCQSEGAIPRQFFIANQNQIANALLSVTDGRAASSPNPPLKRAYSTLRPKAIRYLGAAMPRLAAMVAKHAS